MLDRIAPHEEVEFAKQRLGDLQEGRFDKVEKHLSKELMGPDVRERLVEASRSFPVGAPRSVELIGAQVFHSPGRWAANLSFQYQFEQAWLVANVALDRSSGSLVVTGIHVNRLPDSLEHINAFTVKGKSVIHYLFLVSAILVPSFVVVVLVMCVRSRDLRRKWLWAVFILLGFAGATINWTTGQVGFQLLSFHLLGGGVVAASPYAPWLLTVSFPLGAVVFLLRRLRGSPAQATPTPLASPDAR